MSELIIATRRQVESSASLRQVSLAAFTALLAATFLVLLLADEVVAGI